MPQRFGDIGDVRTGPLQHRGERVPGRIGRDRPDAELLAHLLHALVDRVRQILGPVLGRHGILPARQYRKDEGIRAFRIAPAVNDLLHRRGQHYPNIAQRAERVLGL